MGDPKPTNEQYILTSMTTEYFLINDGSYGQAIEAICKCLPQLYVVPPLACKS